MRHAPDQEPFGSSSRPGPPPVPLSPHEHGSAHTMTPSHMVGESSGERTAAGSPRSQSGRNSGVSARRESPSALLLSRAMWLLGTAMVFFIAWILGPRLVEHYHYAATRARIRAEYDVATVALNEQPLTGLSTAYQMVARRIRPSVVHISTRSRMDPQEREFFLRHPLLDEEFTEGQGSGVIMDTSGYILTNEHVVRDASEIEVVLSDRRAYRAELIGVDEPTDLAVIKIEADDLIPAELGDSEALEVGSMVWAVGSPFGLEQSVTFGIISAKHRKTNENPFQDLIQSDAAVNPGNSGGPLVNAKGQVVGINTSIVGKSYQGISFAVPSSLAEQIYSRIKEEGKVERGFLGVAPALVSHQVAVAYKLPSLDGAYIDRVEPGSPAARAGIQEGDVILRWNGKPISNDILLFRHVGLTRINSTAEVVLWRDGKEVTVYVNVADSPLNL